MKVPAGAVIKHHSFFGDFSIGSEGYWCVFRFSKLWCHRVAICTGTAVSLLGAQQRCCCLWECWQLCLAFLRSTCLQLSWPSSGHLKGGSEFPRV